MDSCLLFTFLNGVLESLLAGYLLLMITKFYALIRIWKFLGGYIELPTLLSDKEYLKKLKYTVHYDWTSLITPVLHTSISVQRKNVINQNDNMDWSGKYHSDILNPFYFRGIYIITKPGERDYNGWHEMILFKDNRNDKRAFRIALRVNYLDPNRREWVSNGGYYIEKIKR